MSGGSIQCLTLKLFSVGFIFLFTIGELTEIVSANRNNLQETEFFHSPEQSALGEVLYETVQLSKLKVFYREVGDPKNPTILLLHGFPASSHMFRNLLPSLAAHAHLIAPDLPGFGNTEAPVDGTFNYTFDNLAETIGELIDHLGLEKYFMYLMDYGAPTGFRIATAHPNRVLGFIVQNGNAYVEGLTPFWDPIRKYWKDKTPENAEALTSLLSLETTKLQYTLGAHDLLKVSPDNWFLDYYFLQLPGHVQLNLDLFYDYQFNVALYPAVQELLRKYQFPTLIVWGKNDISFGVAGAEAYLRDLPKAELHLIDGGHFVLEDHLDEIAYLIKRFVKATVH